jgi:hypothetical protein
MSIVILYFTNENYFVIYENCAKHRAESKKPLSKESGPKAFANYLLKD